MLNSSLCIKTNRGLAPNYFNFSMGKIDICQLVTCVVVTTPHKYHIATSPPLHSVATSDVKFKGRS